MDLETEKLSLQRMGNMYWPDAICRWKCLILTNILKRVWCVQRCNGTFIFQRGRLIHDQSRCHIFLDKNQEKTTRWSDSYFFFCFFGHVDQSKNKTREKLGLITFTFVFKSSQRASILSRWVTRWDPVRGNHQLGHKLPASHWHRPIFITSSSSSEM